LRFKIHLKDNYAEKKKRKKKEYWSKSQLKKKGWTERKIKGWLREPDKLVKNPFYSSAPPMQLYSASRVKRQEKNKRFKEWLGKSKTKRKKLSKKLKEVNERKRQELIDYINTLEIKIPKMPLKKLREEAVEHYNWLWQVERGRYDKFATVNDDEKFLNRICVNYLRHEHRHYESEIAKMFGKVGKDEGYLLLKKKINEEIFKVYPELKDNY
jgi:hypothetical protein